MPYFNYDVTTHDSAEAGYWARREFLAAWWSIYGDDDRWMPPDYGRLRRALNPRHNPHLARLEASLVYVEALHRTGVRRSRTDQQEIPLTSVLERPLAAAVSLIDPRRRGKTAHLALAHFGPDAEAFDHLYYHLVETLAARNYHRVIAPVGLSPYLDSGLLVDSWNAWPPLHTPSNPPYVPELVERRWQPFLTGRLFHVAVPPEPPDRSGPAVVRPFDPARLAGDLLPLLIAATENPAAGFPPPDAAEAAFLLWLLGPEGIGLLAQVSGEPAGFVLFGPDTAGRMRAARGGRPLWGRALLALETRFSPKNRFADGRVYFGGVVPDRRGQGIGDQLWRATLAVAAGHAWKTVAVGPVWTEPAASFLAKRGAIARQRYQLYDWHF